MPDLNANATKPIPAPAKPGEGPKGGFLDYEYAAMIVAALNALRNITIKPDGAGELLISDANIVLTLKGLGAATPIACQGNFEGTYTTKYLLEVPAP